MSALFGPAGNSNSFAEMGYKSTLDAPEYISKMGLDVYEYQCGRGVRVNADSAEKFRQNAEKFGVIVTLHAPYYISLSSVEDEKRLKSVDYILQSARAVKMLGGNRIVVHSGSCSKISREEALSLASDTLKKAQSALDSEGLGDVHICPETMGKINQLGTLDEVIELCRIDDRMLPCVDFGHLNARTLGGMNSHERFAAALDSIGNILGSERLNCFHVHFSKIEYSAGGEKRHLTFADEQFGPGYEPFCDEIVRRGISPVVICESDGTQCEDALEMKRYIDTIAH